MHSSQRSSAYPAKQQQGIAIVTVLLVVALTTILAASIIWRERIAVRDVENQRIGAETMWVERAAVEWARATLRAQSLSSNAAYYGQAWSVPVNDVRLANVMPRDALEVNGDLAEASISGRVEDAQAKFNLMDLVSRPEPGQPYQLNAEGVAAYSRLLGALSINPGMAQLTAAYILRSLSIGSNSTAPLQLVSVQDLSRIPGYEDGVLKVLAPMITLLPDQTTVNVNTATTPVLMAAIPELTESQAQRLVARRNTAYFLSTGEIAETLSTTRGSAELPSGALAGVNSGYFIVHCQIHSKRINTHIDTLIGRYGVGAYSWTSVLWVHRLAL